MTERIPCKNNDCNRTILPTTAEETGGLCMPCYQANKRKEKKAHIEKNKVKIDLFHDITDPVEILTIMHTPRKYNPFEELIQYPMKKEEIYPRLNESQITKLLDIVNDFILNDDVATAEEIMLHIACMTEIPINSGLEIFCQHKHFYPDVIFRKANKEIRDFLISMVEEDSNNRNHILCALPWIEDQVVFELYKKWKSAIPQWASELHVLPHKYSEQAGWTIDDEGRKESLIFHKCYPFVAGKPSPNDAVVAITYTDQACMWCNSPLVCLFDIDLTSQHSSFLGLNGERLKISTCSNCTAFGPIFMQADLKGNFRWCELNQTPKYLPDDIEDFERLPEQMVKISTEQRRPNFAANQFLQTTFSQVGGYPTWIQNAEYLDCPKCGNRMQFTGQIDHEDLQEIGEGLYYAHICKACLITGTNYQQT
jgi:predicted nucleic-acid-binding Zn-ribbon protein